ncbi:zinc-finger of transposase IS204/IS1001/IS1096/IS1165 [Evansella caseinilytica]|uniref:Zinc-finger of transposase IS204/IS1001/IS1096/IS1165 n=1 Tax=Evansella caseinilytica TaxID=1503961 RepID=A0A1H3UI49_9BACI|nr:transposase family protein [Evansella caseinilytica]SDZ61299.1 zinc-finger of transposase IS204/IS1001/IS1096/IS1165 [Evansella caseinilytica]
MKNVLHGLEELHLIGKIAEEETVIRVELVKTSPPRACPHCGCPANFYKHGHRQQIVLDKPLKNKLVELVIQRKRCKCKECHVTL